MRPFDKLRVTEDERDSPFRGNDSLWKKIFYLCHSLLDRESPKQARLYLQQTGAGQACSG